MINDYHFRSCIVFLEFHFCMFILCSLKFSVLLCVGNFVLGIAKPSATQLHSPPPTPSTTTQLRPAPFTSTHSIHYHPAPPSSTQLHSPPPTPSTTTQLHPAPSSSIQLTSTSTQFSATPSTLSELKYRM